MSKKEKNYSDIAVNKKARFNFELLDFFEAGIILTGSEVKSLREKKANLTDSYAQVKGSELVLYNSHISPYKNGGYANHEENRTRKLLVHKKEILKLERLTKEKGQVIVAVKLYFNEKGFVKVQLATAKPKKEFDKREDMQKKESKIEMERALKSRNKYE